MKNFDYQTISLFTGITIISLLMSQIQPVSAQSVDTDTPTPTDTFTPVPTDTDTPVPLPSDTPAPTSVPATATPGLVAMYPGLYDDNFPRIRYTGWLLHTLNGLYYNTEHYSGTPGNTAQFAFVGTSFSLKYRNFTTFGTLGVNIDGIDYDPIDMNASMEIRDQEYSSQILSQDLHTVTLTHLTGLYIAFDAIQVNGQPTDTPMPSETSIPTNTWTVTNTYIPSRTPTLTSTPTVTLTPEPVGPGQYDDTDLHFGYSGWQYHVATGLFMNTEHYASSPGSTASITFDGVSVIIYYRKFSTFGSLQVFIDDTLQRTINQNSAIETRDQSWGSATFPAGLHTLKLVHANGTYVAFDSITVLGPGTPTYTLTASNTATPTRTRTNTNTPSYTPTITRTPSASKTLTASKTFTPSRTPTPTMTPQTIPAMKIDDADYRIVYTGWLQRSVTGLYNNSEHYSGKAGDTAYLIFRGTGITVYYRGFSTFGNISVAIDGVTVGEINQYNPIEIRNQSWSSNVLPLGVHTLMLTHNTGSYTVFDAILIDGPATTTPTPTNTKTPTSTRTNTRTKPPTYTYTPSKTFTPSRTPTRTYTSTSTKTPAIIGLGILDDSDNRIQYTNWTGHTLSGSYNNTEHYSTKLGGAAVIRFMGEGVSIQYRTAGTFGTMNVTIDSDTYTINQYSVSGQNNLSWASPAVSPGIHTLTLSQAASGYVTMDSITIPGTPTSTPTPTNTRTPTATQTPSPTKTPTITFTASITPTASNTPLPAIVGIYDDNDYRIAYNGWQFHTLTGMYNNTEHYSQTIASTASLTFKGTGFTLSYRKFTSFGGLEVRLDGVLVTTINQYSASELRSQSWVSPTYADGVHVLTVTHATGTTVALDSITVR
jgi:hypothetical protein